MFLLQYFHLLCFVYVEINSDESWAQLIYRKNEENNAESENIILNVREPKQIVCPTNPPTKTS